MRNSKYSKTLLSSAVLLIAFFFFSNAEAKSARFLVMGDIYGLSAEERPVGGAGRLITALRSEQDRSSGDRPVFTFHAGDALSPSYFSIIDKGETMLGILNLMGLDAFVPGNHEFDVPYSSLLDRIRESKFPWVAANILYDGKPIPGIKRWLLLEKSGVKVAVAGTMTDHVSGTDAALRRLGVSDPDYALRQILPEMEKAGPDFIVLLSHQDVKTDYELLKKFRPIQLVLGGHDHTPMLLEYEGRLLAKPGSEGKWLLIVDGNTTQSRKFLWDANFLTIDEKFPFDPKAKAYLQERGKLLAPGLNEKIAYTSLPLDGLSGSVRTRESNVGNMVTDAIRDFYTDRKVDIVLLNGGALRWDSMKGPGPLTIRDVYDLLPFDNKAVILRLSGKSVMEAIEHSVFSTDTGKGGFLQVSGLKFSYDADRPAGSRICKAFVLHNNQWEELQKDKTYIVSMPDFLFSGGDGFTMFKTAEVILSPESAPSIDHILIQWLKGKGETAPKEEGRITNTKCKYK